MPTGENDTNLIVYRENLFRVLPPRTDGLKWRPVHARPVITNANDAMSLIAARAGVPTPLGEVTHFIYQQTWAYNPALPTACRSLCADPTHSGG